MKTLKLCAFLGVFSLSWACNGVASAAPDASDATPTDIMHVSEDAEPMAKGKFAPTWESLSQYQTPDWFRNAKFGIWAHWGPQCQPEAGDWYARMMYQESKAAYKSHLAKYGPPSKFGFKDIIHEWKAENFDPEKLLALYKRAGAQYFFALANHHDNFDNWDSKYQPWNSVNMGPKKDLIGMWAKAARANGMRFGVSVHAAHAWSWYEPSQGSDRTGPLAGVPYDGNLTKADGKGLWWEGYDPQDLYAQNHKPGKQPPVWDWDVKKGSSIPTMAYVQKFFNRTIDLIDQYHPDLVYFDDSVLPLYPISDAGLKIAAHLYNSDMARHDGKLEAVMFNKDLDEMQKHCMVLDIERGQSPNIEPLPWQSDTCLGNWHYDRSIYLHHKYKTTKTVVQTLCDIVSKNGNLLLNVPVRGDGTIDDDEVKIVEGISKWMDVNREAIFDSRPFKVCGDGPALAAAPTTQKLGFNEGKGKPFTAEDFRYTTKGDTLYAIEMGWPTKTEHLKSLGTDANLLDKAIADVKLLGSDEKINWKQAADGLAIEPPAKQPCDDAFVYVITLK